MISKETQRKVGKAISQDKTLEEIQSMFKRVKITNEVITYVKKHSSLARFRIRGGIKHCYCYHCNNLQPHNEETFNLFKGKVTTTCIECTKRIRINTRRTNEIENPELVKHKAKVKRQWYLKNPESHIASEAKRNLKYHTDSEYREYRKKQMCDSNRRCRARKLQEKIDASRLITN